MQNSKSKLILHNKLRFNPIREADTIILHSAFCTLHFPEVSL